MIVRPDNKMFAYCDLCDGLTPVCMECYNANTLWEVFCEYCHEAYGHEDELL